MKNYLAVLPFVVFAIATCFVLFAVSPTPIYAFLASAVICGASIIASCLVLDAVNL